MRKRFKGSRVQGIAINDADYQTTVYVKYTRLSDRKECLAVYRQCPYYRKWHSLVDRCCSARIKKLQPSYKDCTLQLNWLLFSSFKTWMETQDWQGKELDKDLLVRGNKHYGETTCVFVDKRLNTFLVQTENDNANGLPKGVSWYPKYGKYLAQCRDPFSNRRGFIKYCDTIVEARVAWLERKHEYALKYAEMQTDERLKQALRTRFADDLEKAKVILEMEKSNS